MGQQWLTSAPSDATRCGVVAFDDDGVIRAWNRGAADLLGWGEDVAVGRALGEILAPPAFMGVDAGHRSIVPSSLAAGDRTWTVAVRRADGTETTVLLDVAAVDAGGRRLLVGLLRPADVSAQPGAPAADLLQILFERAPETITITDSEGRQRLVNATGLRMLRFDPALRTPPDGIDFVHPDDREKLAEHRLRLIRLTAEQGPGAQLPAIRFRVRDGAGRWRWLETLVADMTDIPEVAGRVSFSRDVTEAEERAQALIESEARLRALVASFPGGAFLSDGTGRVLLANQALTGLFPGMPPAAGVIGMALAAVIARLNGSLSQPLLPCAEDETWRGSWDAELELRDGRVVDAEVIPIGGPDAGLGRLWLFRDATDRRDRARQQERLLELEQAARQAAEAQAEQLQAYDKLRNDFVSSVSHALRTPLASITSAAQLLLTQQAAADAATRSYLDIIDRNAERLRQMVENLLLAGRLDAGMLALDLAQVRVDGLIREVTALLRPVALQRQVRLVVRSAAITATADRTRLAEIVENLVGNAVKYTRPGTDVTVTASSAPGGWMISVADHGPGIPPDQREAVFGRFVRAADAERDGTRGSGLGLAITKGLVELHGGSIEVGDAPGGGAVFSCWFPAGPRSA